MKKIIAMTLLLFVGIGLASCKKEDPQKEYTIEYANNLTIEVGQTINPRDYFTLMDEKDTAVPKDDINLAIVSGSVNAVGEVKYLITYDGQTFELTLTVVEKKNQNPNPPIDEKDPLLVSMETALKKNYDNVTLSIDQVFKGSVEGVEDNFEVHEVNYVDNNSYHIEYSESESESFEFYVDKQEDYVYLYHKTLNEWRNTPLTYAQWESLDYSGNYVYSDYYSKYVSPQSFSLQSSEFKVEDGKIKCIPTRLDLVGQKIFDVNDDNAVFTSIEIVVEEDTLKQILATYDSTDDYGTFTCEIKYSYSNIGSTKLTFPDVKPEFADEPEHIDPNLATPLTALEKQTLTNALANDYTNYHFEYSYDEDEGYSTIYETDEVNGYTYHIKQTLGGYQSDSFDYYFEIQDVNGNRRYYIYEVDENKRVVRTQLTTQQEIINYMPLAVSPAKLSLSVASFGKVGDQYVCTPAGLNREVSHFTNQSGASLISLVITVDKDERITSIDLITKVDAVRGTYYIEETYSYSKIGQAEVNIPAANSSVLADLTQEQQDTLSLALNKDYSNVTMVDEYTASEFYFAGNQIKTIVYDGYEYVTDLYKIEDGKYYEFKDDAYSEIPFHSDNKEEVSFDYYLPVPNFTAIDLSKVAYDSFHDTYYLAMSDVNIKEFLYYYDIEEALKITFTGIEFVLDSNGNIAKINLEAVDSDGTYYIGYGLAYLNIGTTTI